jgi:hypothetical protein
MLVSLSAHLSEKYYFSAADMLSGFIHPDQITDALLSKF